MPSAPLVETTPRYHSLDELRAVAMLLGVLWHATQGAGSGPLAAIMGWLHSFRMPLFMLISGFFGRMMLAKYGLRLYLGKRWWRIGLPLLIGLFTFMPIYHQSGPMAGGPGGPPGGMGVLPPPPPGEVPPFLQRFDADGNGSLSEAEWKKAQSDGPGLGPPGGGPGGPRGFGPPGMRSPASRLNQLLFGETGRLFSLGHLWFLWYLLVFVTVAPPVAAAASWVATATRGGSDRLADGATRSGVAPLILGLICVPCLMITQSFMGWGLPLASGIGGRFPDFLFEYQPDWPFYFAYFLAGWWLYRERAGLPAIGRTWVPSLAFGTAAYLVFRLFARRYERQTELPHYDQFRLVGYGLSSVAAAYTSWGLLGLFQRHFDRPTRVGRYFSETALWIYLVHQDILGPVSRILGPLGLPAWGQGLLATGAAIALAAGLYELIVRPTPLIRIFGPGAAGRQRAVDSPMAARTKGAASPIGTNGVLPKGPGIVSRSN